LTSPSPTRAAEAVAKVVAAEEKGAVEEAERESKEGAVVESASKEAAEAVVRESKVGVALA